MAEEKRIFNKAKMNRDIDDRLLPSGEYRYALNVNIGESEGGDIGALENLKGNEQIGRVAPGTTVGVIRDPNEDRIYWFNAGDQVDAIHEYDQSTNTVTTLIQEVKVRPDDIPTCAPSLRTTISTPTSATVDRDTFDTIPPAPDASAFFYNFAADNTAIPNTVVSGESRAQGPTAGTDYTVPTQTIGIRPADGFTWEDQSLLRAALSTNPTITSLNLTYTSGSAVATVTGSVANTGTATVTWTGARVVADRTTSCTLSSPGTIQAGRSGRSVLRVVSDGGSSVNYSYSLNAGRTSGGITIVSGSGVAGTDEIVTVNVPSGTAAGSYTLAINVGSTVCTTTVVVSSSVDVQLGWLLDPESIPVGDSVTYIWTMMGTGGNYWRATYRSTDPGLVFDSPTTVLGQGDVTRGTEIDVRNQSGRVDGGRIRVTVTLYSDAARTQVLRTRNSVLVSTPINQNF